MKLYGIWDVFVVVVDDFCFSKRFNDVLGMISQFIVPSLMADDVVFDYSLHMLE